MVLIVQPLEKNHTSRLNTSMVRVDHCFCLGQMSMTLIPRVTSWTNTIKPVMAPMEYNTQKIILLKVRDFA
jgi:hypothetical protein